MSNFSLTQIALLAATSRHHYSDLILQDARMLLSEDYRAASVISVTFSDLREMGYIAQDGINFDLSRKGREALRTAAHTLEPLTKVLSQVKYSV